MGGRNKYNRVLPGGPKSIISDTAINIPVSCSSQHSASCFGLSRPLPILATYIYPLHDREAKDSLLAIILVQI